MNRTVVLKVCAPLLALALVGCETQKSSNPLSPSVAGPIPGVNITAPQTVDPAAGAQIAVANQPITLTIQNASTSGVRPLSYTFEVATDNGFANKVFSRDGITPGDGGKTSVRLPDALPSGRTYYWRSRAQDGANSGPFTGGVPFTIYTPVLLDPPALVAPLNASTLASLTPGFKINNAARTGPATAVTYRLQLATNAAFTALVAIWDFAEQSTQTTFNAPIALAYATTYYWRVEADDPSGAHSAWSAVASFSTPAAPPPPEPPATGGGSSGGGGAACSGSTQLSIVQCRRSQYPTPMSSSQHVSFLKDVARDLNAKGFAPGGFGLLAKSSGSSCNGFSCDVICAGQGTAQQQWDVLGDSEGAANPTWNGPHTYGSIRVDTCSAP